MKNQNISTSSPAACCGIRHFQCFLLFCGLAVGYAMRLNLSMAIVAMTDPMEEVLGRVVYSWSEGVKSLVLSSFFWGYVITQIPAGQGCRLIGAKLLFLYGILLSSVLTLLTPYLVSIGDWPVLLVVRGIEGLSQGVLFTCTHNVLSKWSPVHERNILCSLAYAGTFFGAVYMFSLSGWLASTTIGWPSIFYLSGFLGLLWCLVWYLWGANTPDECKLVSLNEKNMIQTSLETQQEREPLPQELQCSKKDWNENLKTPWLKIFTSLPFWVLLVDQCAHNWGFWTLLTQLPSYMRHILEMDIKSNALFSALPYLIMLLLSFVFCFVANFISKRRLLRLSTNRKLFNTIGQWMPTVALIALGYCDNSTKTLAVCLLVACVGLNASSFLGFQVNHIDLSPNFADVLMGLANCAANIMSILAPLLVGFVVTEEKNALQWRTIFFIAAGFYFIGNLLFIVFGKTSIQSWNDPLPKPAELQLIKVNPNSSDTVKENIK